MKTITPEQFIDAFLQVAIQSEGDLIALWTKTAEYTKFMRSSILPKVALHLDLKDYTHVDYWKFTDAIFYENLDLDHFVNPKAIYPEFISVAIEFENDPKGSLVEMNKLQNFNTPLKVLITYASLNESTKLLTVYADIMKRADIFKDFSSHRKQLVIFGPAGKPVPTQLDWTFHVYDNASFTTLK